MHKLQQSRIILIRHANSQFNHAWETIMREVELGQNTEESYFELAKNPSYIDCGLSELGVK